MDLSYAQNKKQTNFHIYLNLSKKKKKIVFAIVEDSFFTPHGTTSLATHATSTYY